MVRTTEKQETRLCKDCAKSAAIEGPRCKDCHRVWKRNAARHSRADRKEAELQENEKLRVTGWQRCTLCKRKRRLSEYRTTQRGRKGKLNKICDSCLTRVYTQPGRLAADTDISAPAFWRRKAYAVNSVATQLRRKELLRRISLAELPWVCKPQDLARLYEAQDGLCAYCGCTLTFSNISVDHATPITRHGTHHVSNFHLTCIDCNYLKGTRTEAEFRAFICEYVARFTQ